MSARLRPYTADMRRRLLWGIVACCSGAVLAGAMPGPGWWPLVLLFPGLLLEALERGEGWRRAALLGWIAGAAHWVIATHWVCDVMRHYGGLSPIGAVAALLGMGAILGLVWAVVAALTALLPGAWRAWFFPFAWVSADALRRFPPIQFPWNDVASVVADHPALLGSLPVWGSSGLGWALVAFGTAGWAMLRRDRRPAAAALLIAAIGLTLTMAAVAPPFEPSGTAVRLAVLQPGTSLEEKWDPAEWREITDRVWTLTRRAADSGAEIVVWPESAVPFRIDADPAYRRVVTSMAAELGIEIVLNSVVEAADGGWVNSAALVTERGVSEVRYDKIHLVPFGEYVPRWAELVTTDALVREVGRFEPGTAMTLLPARFQLGVAVCYEVVFPSHAAAAARAGAEVLVTLTNDGWYGFSWAPRQHFAQVRLRAAEQRRWFARAALTGISGFVDPWGRVVGRLDVGERGVLTAALTPSRTLTPQARWGDWWAVLSAVAVLVLVASFALGRSRAI